MSENSSAGDDASVMMRFSTGKLLGQHFAKEAPHTAVALETCCFAVLLQNYQYWERG